MNDRTSLENQIFTWENWSEEGPMSMQFANVELTVPVGDFPAGTKFPFAFILGDDSLLVLVDDQDQEHTFDLKVSVGDKVDVPEHADSCDCGHEHGVMDER